MPIFWGYKLNVGGSKSADCIEGQAITVGQVSLVNATPGKRYILSIKVEDEEFVLSTLVKDKQDQSLLDFNIFPESPAVFSLKTEDNSVDKAEVHLVGYIQAVDYSSDEGSEFDEEAYNERLLSTMNNGHMESESDEEEEEAPKLVTLATPKKTKPETTVPAVAKPEKGTKRPVDEEAPTPATKKTKKETTVPEKKNSLKVEEKKGAASRCNICSKDFKSPTALQSHNTAKHKTA